MRLSENFTLEEFTKSPWAERFNVPNTPNAKEIEAMKALCLHVLEPIRKHFGKAVVLNSGFRNDKVNAGVGGASSSQHRFGEAADIEIPGVSNYDLASWIKTNLKFDQLILEFYKPGQPSSGWVHVSWRLNRLRNDVLTKVSGEAGYRTGLVK